jgi:hypothetical protein
MSLYTTHHGRVNKKLLARAIGFFQSCCLALPNSRAHLIELYSSLNSKPGWNSALTVKLLTKAYKQLKCYWQAPTPVGRSWYPLELTSVVKLHLTTDASQYAWGGFLNYVKKGEQVAVGKLLTRGVFS